ncbi:MAG: NAD(P)H-dependent oxidoreductase subunit E [Chloroflexi bacterium]|nr:NAD(P)H-dependent oxidoreductase subunit E [Chloroflexota bacterium]
MPLSHELKDRITKDYFLRYATKRAALMPALWMAQQEHGWLSRETVEEVAELLDMHPTDVAAVASFYVMFNHRPVGKKIVEVCENPSCVINGATETLHRICERLGIPAGAHHGGATTADGEFTVRPTECVAACDKAPVIQVNSRYYGPVPPDKVDEFLADMEKFNVEGLPAANDLEGRAKHLRREVR